MGKKDTGNQSPGNCLSPRNKNILIETVVKKRKNLCNNFESSN